MKQHLEGEVMKTIVSVSLFLCLCAGPVWADYNNPPGWDKDPYFTHQSWSFTGQTAAGVPIGADAGFRNASGTPTLTFQTGQGVGNMGMVYDLGTYEPLGERSGGWQISGPMQDSTMFSIQVPNIPNSAMKKEVWFEMTFRVSDMQLAGNIVNQVSFDCYANGIQDAAHKFSYFDQVGGVIGVDAFSQIWLRFEGKFAFTPQPGSELLTLKGTLANGQSVVLDQIDVDTHCIPEPATLSLLAVGALGWLRRRS
jgi:hypothetical protein